MFYSQECIGVHSEESTLALLRPCQVHYYYVLSCRRRSSGGVPEVSLVQGTVTTASSRSLPDAIAGLTTAILGCTHTENATRLLRCEERTRAETQTTAAPTRDIGWWLQLWMLWWAMQRTARVCLRNNSVTVMIRSGTRIQRQILRFLKNNVFYEIFLRTYLLVKNYFESAKFSKKIDLTNKFF